MSALDELQKTCLNTLEDLVSHETGFASLPDDAFADASPLSKKEDALLLLFDRLQDLDFQIELSKAYDDSQSTRTSGEAAEETITALQRDVVDAKAAWTLRNKIVEQAVITHPTLRAVHSGEHADAVERRLLPLILRRDRISIQHTNRSAELLSKQNQLTNVEIQNLILARQNKELTQELLSLAKEAKAWTKGNIKDAKMRSQIDLAENELRIKKARWRIMKSVVAGVIVGSGIDWAGDDALLSLVLDNEGD